MLESYLNQSSKAMPDLQDEANKLAKDIIKRAEDTTTTTEAATATGEKKKGGAVVNGESAERPSQNTKVQS